MPVPAVAMVICPGRDFTSATNALKSRAGTEGCITSTKGTLLMPEIATKSRSGLISGLAYTFGDTLYTEFDAISSVCPSGGDLATISPPIMPPAPGRLSTTTGWPSSSLRPGATARALISTLPPGANGTTIRMGLTGKVCACACTQSASANAGKNILMGLLPPRPILAPPAYAGSATGVSIKI